MSSYALVVNPSAGRGKARADAQRAALRLREHGAQASVLTADSALGSIEMAREAVASGVDAVVACGGDGTINCVLQALVGHDVPLGILPRGTGDDNARLLGIPRSSVEAAVDVILAGKVMRYDVGEVTLDDGQTRWFLGVLSTGFDSDVNEVANEMQRFSGTTKYVAALLRKLRDFSAIEYRVSIDQASLDGRAVLVSIGNGQSYGGGMRVTPNADPQDGLLDLVWLDAVSIPTLLRVFPMVYSGKHVKRSEVHQYTGREFVIDAPGQVAYADGERIGELPIRVRVVPKALPVLTTVR